MPLHTGLLGQRVVVRRLLPGLQGPSGGPAMTDELGVLESWTDSSLQIRREDGQLVTIERRLLVTGKPVPPRTSTRLRIGAEQLERVCALGWRAPVEEPLGEWTMRAASGFTGRANSVRVGGDPGVSTDNALEAIRAFYADHDLPPLVQVVVGSVWQTAIEERGWRQARPDGQDAVVQVGSVAHARRSAAEARQDPALGVLIDPLVTEDWMTVYGRTARTDPAVVRTVMQSGDEVAFARIGDPAVAIGRAVVTGDWMGVQAVEVAPEHRRRGLATAVVDALLEWGASRGALSAYLQTLPDNVAALALYYRYGFVTHHTYRYLSR